jgi:DNA anti-recombination protein RmuC
MKKEQEVKKVDGLGNVDQIREIIFGSQMRELDQRFGRMEASLKAMKEEVDSQLRELKAAMQSEIGNGMELLETKLKNLANLSKEEREALREELMRTDKRLNMALDSLAEEHDTKLSLMKKEAAAANERIKEELAELKRSVQSELDRRLGAMGEAKVSRDMMADVLLDMAMKIKGEGLDITVEPDEGK